MVHWKGWVFKLACIFSKSYILCIYLACLHFISSPVPTGKQAPPTQEQQASCLPSVCSVQHADRHVRGMVPLTCKLPPLLCQWEPRDVPLEHSIVYRLASERSFVAHFREFLGQERPRRIQDASDCCIFTQHPASCFLSSS